ncbi:hypothetical protein AJ80_07149 [Polytolypa hystricis UAMH7299]|uniref:Cytidyltransferase-like domain-containing protein n=1 Tax=Polytolypa hystricis (strain UAMH7299) TaxID=1447883 RepID=A0A2B7XRZ0_POLH7|nr:hypothetical protein AJ80_07149 [Polytolypa hystricis UAMH7299]
MATRDHAPHHEALLLLTRVPSIEFSSLKAAYAPAFRKVLGDLSASVEGTNKIAILDVAVVIDGLLTPESQPRARVFNQLQRLFAGIYRLLSAASVAEDVELDGPGGIDARVVFVDPAARETARRDHALAQGPIIALEDLLTSNHSWGLIYSLESPGGNAVLDAFSLASKERGGSNQSFAIRKLPDTTAARSELTISGDPGALAARKNHSVAVGGTFDHLHAGHKLLLTATALAIDPDYPQQQGKHKTLTIGITGDELLVNKKYAEALESWDDRWKGVWRFLESIMMFDPSATIRTEHVSNPGPNGKYVQITVSPGMDIRFVQISDPFGPTITDEDITGLVVSRETRSGGQAVNDERAKKGWANLDIFEVDVLDLGDNEQPDAATEGFDSKISSTEIRRRRMNLAKGSL